MYFNYKARFKVVFSRDNLPRIKDGAYVINFDDKQSWVPLFINKNTAVYFDSVGIEYIPQQVSSKIKDKSLARNILRIQSDNSVMCGFYCIAFIKYMIVGKSLLDYTNLFFLNDYEKDDKIICKYFKDKYGKKCKSWFYT